MLPHPDHDYLKMQGCEYDMYSGVFVTSFGALECESIGKYWYVHPYDSYKETKKNGMGPFKTSAKASIYLKEYDKQVSEFIEKILSNNPYPLD